eukprot:CAMPEP_0170592594 /NCGR_PEP_ID=MMETSP0224-20130122/13005_1 /TAXON_ID=285029 /ORGANISM="Togula jolla, Strain CCCM 725" /LENGTH=85 /DNA_ID=CAMNT_0010916505 /DNA_START=89 /DNA_END=346 /DNA_ORIENTATION=-
MRLIRWRCPELKQLSQGGALRAQLISPQELLVETHNTGAAHAAAQVPRDFEGVLDAWYPLLPAAVQSDRVQWQRLQGQSAATQPH